MAHGQANITATNSGFIAMLPTEPGLRVLDRGGQTISFRVLPAGRRRGEPIDLLRQQRALPPAKRYQVIGSSAVGLHRLSSGELVMVHLDVDFVGEADKGRFGNFKLFVSMLSPDADRACIDAPVPFDTDVAPIPSFVGDTLFLLSRAVGSDNRVLSKVTGYTVSSGNCEWVKLKAIDGRALGADGRPVSITR
jgi:hypothetical protein